MSTYRLAGAVLTAAVLLGACSSGDSEDAATCTYDTTFEGVAVSGTGGEQATIEVTEESQPATELETLDLCDGDGEAVGPTSVITADYIGVAQSTGEVFDSSFSRGTPATFPIEGVIAGWQEGLQGMQVGGTRMLVIPPELAYGEVSPGPGIGPDETLVFVVDLVAIEGQ